MRQLVDRYNLRMFHRVTRVVLIGPKYKQDLLPELARFTHLQKLELERTSIPDDELETWKRSHPLVVVTTTPRVLTR